MSFANQAIAAGLDVAALTSLKSASINNGSFIPGAAVGGLAYYQMGNVIGQKGQAVSNAIWNVLSTVLSALVGIFYWKEEVNSKKIMGMALAIASLYFLES